jgi:hypothetical protein
VIELSCLFHVEHLGRAYETCSTDPADIT